MSSPSRRRPATHAAYALAATTVLLGAVIVAGCGPSSAATAPVATATASLEISPSPSATPSLASPSGTPGIYADLDGAPAEEDVAHRLALAIMIDDQPSARPQAGFAAASIVWQAPADGGQTRYMMVFQEGEAVDIGPVRSARPYFVRWATEYRGVFGHYGGDNETLHDVIPELKSNFWDMDGLTYKGGCPYHRISSRPMPHNAYTNTESLYSCAAKLGYPDVFSPRAETYTFAEDSPASTLPSSGWILIDQRSIDVRYDYDPAANDYARSLNGQPHLDAANGQRVRARNVVVLFQSLTSYTEPGHVRPVVGSVGSGQALIFREGRVVEGKWVKKTETSLTRLYDAAGTEIPFVRGQIYMQVVPIGTKVTYEAG
jgi:hypothetical protein